LGEIGKVSSRSVLGEMLGGAKEMIEIEDYAECLELGLMPAGARNLTYFYAPVVPKLIDCLY
jgi:hypothetical protein